ncbi:tail fiber assembly protein [Serratia marcescens]|uniref:tail fiber assembly protein n=1 Tax=Serratia marcescens TaxID=615 RepID=UPI0006ED16F6|nr:tail fiber assembly protein [Serratia marcescens]ALL37867.1 tail fiber assembly protein [Serratia marcescens]PHI48455.1 tail fiber assembly protein [Serratia marcescens]UJA56343.1 tail fiber assembly protein [Serratia marcescens]
MSYGYSAKTNIFYVIEDKEGYEAFGNWPDDVKSISDEVWEKFSVQGPAGKMRGADKSGMPCWVDIPPPTREQQTEAAERKKRSLMVEAEGVLAPLERAVKLGMATDEEKARLEAWERYSVLMSRVSPQEVPNITWPEKPA